MSDVGVAKARIASAVGDKALSAKSSASAQFLTRQPPRTAFRAFAFNSKPAYNVVGVGIGKKISKGKLSDARAVRFYVERKFAKESIPKDLLLPEKWQGMPTDVIETGMFFALSAAITATLKALATSAKMVKKIRPAKPGSSIGFAFPDPNDGMVMAGNVRSGCYKEK